MDSPDVLFTPVPSNRFYSQVVDRHRAIAELLNNSDTSALSAARFKREVSAPAVKRPYYE